MATLHLICGLPGAGKTTLAKQLEANMHTIRLCPDEWIHALVSSNAERVELDRLRDPVEKLQWSLAQSLLRTGVDVILESGVWSREERIAYRNTAKELGAEVALHYLNIPKEELWRRIQLRNLETPQGGFRISEHELDEWCTWFTPPDATESKLYDVYEVYGKESFYPCS